MDVSDITLVVLGGVLIVGASVILFIIRYGVFRFADATESLPEQGVITTISVWK